MKKKSSNTVSVLDGKLRYVLPVGLAVIAVCFIVYGIYDKEVNAIFLKAINLCRECVGIG